MFVNHLQNNIQTHKSDIQGCQALVGKDGKCGEMKTLDILKEFQELYENKLNQVKDECSCTSTRIKIQMLQDWVRDLTEQNTMLVQVVEELEQEASERVCLLEEKLRHSSKASFEIMKTLQEFDNHNISNQTDILQRLMNFQSDINNLTEFIRRVRDEGVWSSDGLHFYSVAHEDLCGELVPSSIKNISKQREMEDSLEKLKIELSKSKQRQDEYEKETKYREKLIHDQSEQIEKLNNVVERCANSVPDKQQLLEELHELRMQLKLKTDDFNRLELSVKDMREALTAEVADKHDSVVAMRRECQLLEERCRQADKQTHFKDDIIKEMRKELKQYRSKYDLEEQKANEEVNKKILQLEEENENLHKTISNANAELNILHDLIEKYYKYEECEGKILFDAKHLKISGSETLEINRNDIENSKEKIISLTIEDKEQFDKINTLRSQINLQLSSENITVFHDASSTFFSENDKDSESSDRDFNKTIFRLKTDISKMILWKSDHDMTELKKQASDIENTLQEIESKNQLIKNKDEMIDIQNDTLNVAQTELKELREKLAEIESEREARILEVQNLQQALKLNQNTIEELEKALQNSEEKANNIQHTADLYVQTINLLENVKNKAETEIEQQRITIGNLQDALVSTKQQLEVVQGRSTAELKEKSDLIYSLYHELDEMQTQYMDCYGENVKLTQTADSLRDANLDLKVVNVDLQQDIEELNAKLSNEKDITSSLEEKMQKILYANALLEGDVNFMKNEMSNISGELRVLQELLKLTSTCPVEENNLSLSKSLNVLQAHSESLIDQLKLTQQQMTKEIKLNDISTNKIQELQKLLNNKSTEMEEMKINLDNSIELSQEYEKKIKSMEMRILEFKKLQNINDQKTDEMVMSCNSDLMCLKQKTELLNKILNEKSNEILRLHAELSIKADRISTLVKENETVIKDNKKLNQNALNLEEQLDMYKSRCSDINEKYNKCKSEMEHIKQWEETLQENFLREKKDLTDKLLISQKEEAKLNNMLQELKVQLDNLKQNLKQKDDEVKGLTSAQEEVIFLKEEINKLTKQRNRVITDNQKLQDQITKLNVNSTQFENRNVIISKQLDKCLEELNTLQCSKDKLEEKNIRLETEIEHLQRVFTELNHEIRYKNESVVNLEQELSETKSSRDEICAESRIVVNNVRSWLEEQKRINITLNNTVKEKNMIIEELTVERNLLLKNIKDVCERYETLSEELHLCRQYLIELNDDQPKTLKYGVPIKRSTHIWGSQGSVGESPISSPTFLEDPRYNYPYEDNDGEPNPAKWMRKVQHMSEDLLRTKKYWQTKMSSKKMKPVKECRKSVNSL